MTEYIGNAKRLQTKEFADFLTERLSIAMNHPVINQKRIVLPCDLDAYFYDEEEDNADFWERAKNKSKKVEIGKEFIKGEIKTVYKSYNYCAVSDYKDHSSYPLNNYEKQICTKPYLYHDGIIAGGAVAALANEFIFGTPAVINDIDYFYFSHFKFKTDMEFHENAYEHFGENELDIKIQRSHKEGILNFIKFEVYNTQNKWTSDLFNEFDLNCCMIGFHPETKKVILTHSFAEFINTHLITHCNSEMNFSNIVRAKRKSEELSSKYYFQDSVRSLILKDLKSSSHRDEWEICHYLMEKKEIPLLSKNKMSIRFLAQKDVDYLKDNPNHLAPYFYYNEKKNQLRYGDGVPLVSFYQEYTLQKGSWKKYRYSKESNWFIIKNLLSLINEKYPKEEISPIYYDRLLNLINGLKEAELSIAHDENDFGRLEKLKLFLTQEIPQDKFLKLMGQLKEHPRCIGGVFTLLNLGWSYGQVDLFFRQIKNSPKEFYGIFEDLLKSVYKKKDQEHATVKIKDETIYVNFKEGIDQTYTKIKYIYNEILKHKNVVLREKTNLKIFENMVSELTTGVELHFEGVNMNHCVGGRMAGVADQNIRIFHINQGSEQTTLELRLYGHQWKLGEHKAHSNKSPSKKRKAFAELFVNYVNLYHL